MKKLITLFANDSAVFAVVILAFLAGGYLVSLMPSFHIGVNVNG